MKDIKLSKNLEPLWNLLPKLNKENNNYEFWLQFERELRSYLCIDMRAVTDCEDAFQEVLTEIYLNPNKFCPTDEIFTIEHSFYKKINLLKLAFLNRVRKNSLGEVRQRIIMLEHKKNKGKLGEDESKVLWHLKKVRSKFLGKPLKEEE